MIVYKLVKPEEKRLYSPFTPRFARVRYTIGVAAYPKDWLKNYGLFAYKNLHDAEIAHNLYKHLHLYEAEADTLDSSINYFLLLDMSKTIHVGINRLNSITFQELTDVLGRQPIPSDFVECVGLGRDCILCKSLTLTKLVRK